MTTQSLPPEMHLRFACRSLYVARRSLIDAFIDLRYAGAVAERDAVDRLIGDLGEVIEATSGHIELLDGHIEPETRIRAVDR